MPQSRVGRDALLVLVLIIGVTSTGYLGNSDVGWFPQQYSRTFYIVKGLVAVAAVVLMLIHMSRSWPTIATAAQRLRYLALLMLTVLIASGSTAQISEAAPVSGRNIGALLGAVLVIVAMAVSIRQDRHP